MGYSIEIRRSGFEVEPVVFARGRGAASTVRCGERHPFHVHAVPAAEHSGLNAILIGHERDVVVVIHSALGSVSLPLSWPWTGTD
jgi:hypothetical protein